MTQPWTFLHDRVHRTIRLRQLLSHYQRLLVAVSGGQDSLCLMQLMMALQPKWGWQLAIAHCDHQWRSDSTANAAYVETLASRWRVPFHLIKAEQPPPTEAAARDWRYACLAELAQTHQFDAVLTGHTASDRAETLLANLMRGSGADGLQALQWSRELAVGVRLVRPLLDISRRETAAFCHEAQLTVWEDATNSDRKFTRNRIRHDLLPYLETHFNPAVEQALAQTAELLRADVEYLESTARQLLDQVRADEKEPPFAPRLKRAALKDTPLALQRRVMRLFLQQALTIAPEFDHVEKMTRLIAAPNRTQTDPFPGGMIARVETEWIVLRSPEHSL